MAKKSKKKNKKQQVSLKQSTLPNNILLVGERVEEDKNIYIYQPVYKEIHKFTKNKLVNESGGILVGSVVEEFGKINIIIEGFIEAKFCDATPTTLTFTHKTWEACHKEIDKKYKGKKIVGWIHTHPNFGIFLSEYDRFVHENFFSEEYQVAYVVDPIQSIEGFYFWINSKLEKCKGFYKFDKTGVKITDDTKQKSEEKSNEKRGFGFKDILIMVLAVAVVFLGFANLSQNKEIKQLQSQQTYLEKNYDEKMLLLQQNIEHLNARINALEIEERIPEQKVEKGENINE